jgi:hypothetical protein
VSFEVVFKGLAEFFIAVGMLGCLGALMGLVGVMGWCVVLMGW